MPVINPRVPEGLRELMKGLTKEVLREKPPNIYEFSANYFETLLHENKDFIVREYEPAISYENLFQAKEQNQIPVALVFKIIPEGLTELIKEFIKAVLRENPKNLCEFAVEYFRHIKNVGNIKNGTIQYTAYENYFNSKERFVFTPYVKCTCGRTFGEGLAEEKPINKNKFSKRGLQNANTKLPVYSTLAKISAVSAITSEIPSKCEDDASTENKAGTQTVVTQVLGNATESTKITKVNDERYIKAIYVIQRFFKRCLKKKILKSAEVSTENGKSSITPHSNRMTEEAAAIIIQRSMRKLFTQKLHKDDMPIVPHLENIQHLDEHNDNVSEAASYTSASTVQMSAESAGETTEREIPEIGTIVSEEQAVIQTIEEGVEQQNDSAAEPNEINDKISNSLEGKMNKFDVVNKIAATLILGQVVDSDKMESSYENGEPQVKEIATNSKRNSLELKEEQAQETADEPQIKENATNSQRNSLELTEGQVQETGNQRSKYSNDDGNEEMRVKKLSITDDIHDELDQVNDDAGDAKIKTISIDDELADGSNADIINPEANAENNAEEAVILQGNGEKAASEYQSNELQSNISLDNEKESGTLHSATELKSSESVENGSRIDDDNSVEQNSKENITNIVDLHELIEDNQADVEKNSDLTDNINNTNDANISEENTQEAAMASEVKESEESSVSAIAEHPPMEEKNLDADNNKLDSEQQLKTSQDSGIVELANVVKDRFFSDQILSCEDEQLQEPITEEPIVEELIVKEIAAEEKDDTHAEPEMSDSHEKTDVTAEQQVEQMQKETEGISGDDSNDVPIVSNEDTQKEEPEHIETLASSEEKIVEQSVKIPVHGESEEKNIVSNQNEKEASAEVTDVENHQEEEIINTLSHAKGNVNGEDSVKSAEKTQKRENSESENLLGATDVEESDEKVTFEKSLSESQEEKNMNDGKMDENASLEVESEEFKVAAIEANNTGSSSDKGAHGGAAIQDAEDATEISDSKDVKDLQTAEKEAHERDSNKPLVESEAAENANVDTHATELSTSEEIKHEVLPDDIKAEKAEEHELGNTEPMNKPESSLKTPERSTQNSLVDEKLEEQIASTNTETPDEVNASSIKKANVGESNSLKKENSVEATKGSHDIENKLQMTLDGYMQSSEAISQENASIDDTDPNLSKKNTLDDLNEPEAIVTITDDNDRVTSESQSRVRRDLSATELNQSREENLAADLRSEEHDTENSVSKSEADKSAHEGHNQTVSIDITEKNSLEKSINSEQEIKSLSASGDNHNFAVEISNGNDPSNDIESNERDHTKNIDPSEEQTTGKTEKSSVNIDENKKDVESVENSIPEESKNVGTSEDRTEGDSVIDERDGNNQLVEDEELEDNKNGETLSSQNAEVESKPAESIGSSEVLTEDINDRVDIESKVEDNNALKNENASFQEQLETIDNSQNELNNENHATLDHDTSTATPNSFDIGTQNSHESQNENDFYDSEQSKQVKVGKSKILDNSSKLKNTKKSSIITGQPHEPLIAEIHLKSFNRHNILENLTLKDILQHQEFEPQQVDLKENTATDTGTDDENDDANEDETDTKTLELNIVESRDVENQSEAAMMPQEKERTATYLYGVHTPCTTPTQGRRNLQKASTTFTIPFDDKPVGKGVETEKALEYTSGSSVLNELDKNENKTQVKRLQQDEIPLENSNKYVANHKLGEDFEESDLDAESPPKFFAEQSLVDEIHLNSTVTAEEAELLKNLETSNRVLSPAVKLLNAKQSPRPTSVGIHMLNVDGNKVKHSADSKLLSKSTVKFSTTSILNEPSDFQDLTSNSDNESDLTSSWTCSKETDENVFSDEFLSESTNDNIQYRRRRSSNIVTDDNDPIKGGIYEMDPSNSIWENDDSKSLDPSNLLNCMEAKSLNNEGAYAKSKLVDSISGENAKDKEMEEKSNFPDIKSRSSDDTNMETINRNNLSNADSKVNLFEIQEIEQPIQREDFKGISNESLGGVENIAVLHQTNSEFPDSTPKKLNEAEKSSIRELESNLSQENNLNQKYHATKNVGNDDTSSESPQKGGKIHEFHSDDINNNIGVLSFNENDKIHGGLNLKNVIEEDFSDQIQGVKNSFKTHEEVTKEFKYIVERNIADDSNKQLQTDILKDKLGMSRSNSTDAIRSQLEELQNLKNYDGTSNDGEISKEIIKKAKVTKHPNFKGSELKNETSTCEEPKHKDKNSTYDPPLNELVPGKLESKSQIEDYEIKDLKEGDKTRRIEASVPVDEKLLNTNFITTNDSEVKHETSTLDKEMFPINKKFQGEKDNANFAKLETTKNKNDAPTGSIAQEQITKLDESSPKGIPSALDATFTREISVSEMNQIVRETTSLQNQFYTTRQDNQARNAMDDNMNIAILEGKTPEVNNAGIEVPYSELANTLSVPLTTGTPEVGMLTKNNTIQITNKKEHSANMPILNEFKVDSEIEIPFEVPFQEPNILESFDKQTLKGTTNQLGATYAKNTSILEKVQTGDELNEPVDVTSEQEKSKKDVSNAQVDVKASTEEPDVNKNEVILKGMANALGATFVKNILKPMAAATKDETSTLEEQSSPVTSSLNDRNPTTEVNTDNARKPVSNSQIPDQALERIESNKNFSTENCEETEKISASCSAEAGNDDNSSSKVGNLMENISKGLVAGQMLERKESVDNFDAGNTKVVENIIAPEATESKHENVISENALTTPDRKAKGKRDIGIEKIITPESAQVLEVMSNNLKENNAELEKPQISKEDLSNKTEETPAEADKKVLTEEAIFLKNKQDNLLKEHKRQTENNNKNSTENDNDHLNELLYDVNENLEKTAKSLDETFVIPKQADLEFVERTITELKIDAIKLSELEELIAHVPSPPTSEPTDGVSDNIIDKDAAATTIQKYYKGYKVRQGHRIAKELQEHNNTEDQAQLLKIEAAAILIKAKAAFQIQKAFRKYIKNKQEKTAENQKEVYAEENGNTCKFADAAQIIQRAYRNYKANKLKGTMTKSLSLEDMASTNENSLDESQITEIYNEKYEIEKAVGDLNIIASTKTLDDTIFIYPENVHVTRRRSAEFIEPSAPPIEEHIEHEVEFSKVHWFVGEEPIVRSAPAVDIKDDLVADSCSPVVVESSHDLYTSNNACNNCTKPNSTLESTKTFVQAKLVDSTSSLFETDKSLLTQNISTLKLSDEIVSATADSIESVPQETEEATLIALATLETENGENHADDKTPSSVEKQADEPETGKSLEESEGYEEKAEENKNGTIEQEVEQPFVQEKKDELGNNIQQQSEKESTKLAHEVAKRGSTELFQNEAEDTSKLDLLHKGTNLNDSIPVETEMNNTPTQFIDMERNNLETDIPYTKLIDPSTQNIISPIDPVDGENSQGDVHQDTLDSLSALSTPDLDLETEPSSTDSLELMTKRLHDTEVTIERMQLRRASTAKSNSNDDGKIGHELSFDEPIIKSMQELQENRSSEFEDEEAAIIFNRLQREDTRESSAQSDAVVYGEDDGKNIDYEFEDTPLMKISLQRVHTIAGDDPKSLFKSVTIDDTVLYIEPPECDTTATSGSSFCLDDDVSENIRKKMMAYSLSEADSDFFDNDGGDATARMGNKKLHKDDFNISTALVDLAGTSTETESTIVSAATRIQAGARGFLTRKRLRRTSGGTKSTIPDNSKASFGNDAISESLERLIEEEAAKKIQHAYRRHYRQKDSKFGKKKVETGSAQKSNADAEEDAHVLQTFESTLAARRLTLQRGDALRNDSTPDEDNGNGNGNGKSQSSASNESDKGIGQQSSSMEQRNAAESSSEENNSTYTHPRTEEIDSTESYDEILEGQRKQSSSEENNLTYTHSGSQGNESSQSFEEEQATDGGQEQSKAKMSMDVLNKFSTSSLTADDNNRKKIDNELKWIALRQHSMPVQIDSEVFRIIPKHMRKRIKSAETQKKKNKRVVRD